MIRAFEPTPLPDGMIDGLLDQARRAPSAGNTQATGFVILEGPSKVDKYWSVTMPEPKRSSFRWQQLLKAPAIIIVTVDPHRYVARYAETDKEKTGLGISLDAWPVPYWWVDAGAVAQNLLLLATDAGLGACLFGPFDHEPELIRALGIPANLRLVASIAIGYPMPGEPGRSAKRTRPPIDQLIIRP